jgi:YVTN family beta-propeller protein
VFAACGGTTPQTGGPPHAPSIGTVATSIHLGEAAQHAAVGTQGIWFLNAVDGLADEVDPATNQVVASISLGTGLFAPTNILAIPEVNALWVTQAGGTVRRIDLSTGQVVATIPVSTQAVFSMTATASPPTLWVASYTDYTVTRIDMRTNKVVATITVGAAPDDIEAGGGTVWVCNLRDDQAIQQIDPQTNHVVTRVTMHYSNFGGEGCGSIRFTANAMWVMSYHGAVRTTVLLRIDPHTYATVATIPLGSDYIGFNTGVDERAVWVSDNDASKLLKVDAQTNRVVGQLPLNQSPGAATVVAGAVWVSSSYDQNQKFPNDKVPSDTLWRITPAP